LLILLYLLAGLYPAPATAASAARWDENSLAMRRLEATNEIFQKYGSQYNFDGLMLAGLGWQESNLNPRARGPGGYIGLMQIMPSTARRLGIRDAWPADANVHAATKYMDVLLAQEFRGVRLSTENRFLFGIASYNAGGRTIAQFRREAKKCGYNPNIWFNNVELVANRQTVRYVRSVWGHYHDIRHALRKEASKWND
jgi:membrane-bound lytic murein transglycosylase MltF